MRLLRGIFHASLVGLAAWAGAAEPAGKAPSPKRDWPQLGGSPAKNNVAPDAALPITWSAGLFESDGRPVPRSSTNVKWVAQLEAGSWPVGLASGPAVHGGKVFIGSNNSIGYVARLPREQDLAYLRCFREADGKFLWQFSSQKLSTGRVEDYPSNGLMSTPYLEVDRLWIVTNRDEIVCLDVEGFADGENDGPFRDEPNKHPDEADVVWKIDLREQFGVSPHNLARSSITAAGDALFVGTSNGLDGRHRNVPNLKAPSFLALDKNTGQVLWTAGLDAPVLHGQWSSPALATLAGKPQVLFGGGDGWLYSFLQAANKNGQAQPLWKFDCNASRLAPGGERPVSKFIVGSPVIYQDRVYATIGEDPEHGDGPGCLWCIDPSRQGDVSAEVGAGPNPNSAVVWKYEQFDLNADGRIEPEETMHLANGSPAIQDELLVVADLSGRVHCLDARTGRVHWTHDLLAACFCTPLIAGGHIYVGDEDGDMTIFKLSAEKHVEAEINMPESILGAPMTAGGVLYVLTQKHLFAIAAPGP